MSSKVGKFNRCAVLIAAGLLLIPTPMNAKTESSTAKEGRRLERATLAGGCFWCVEAVYERVRGVQSVTSGYAGGKTPDPTYEQVVKGGTGHAEVVQIEYDPGEISYEELIDLFWEAHDPTTLNRQGPDVGSQYRSMILYHNEEQKESALRSKKKAASRFSDPIVTEIVPLERFYPAEDYHQDYFQKNPEAPYCVYVIDPKLEKLQDKGVLGEK